MSSNFCRVDGCDRPADRGDLCWSHVRQMQRGRPFTPIQVPLSPEEAVIKAGNDWLEADEDDDYRKARTRFLMVTERWLRAQGWRPPVPPRRPPCCAHLVQLVLPLKVRRPALSTARDRMGA